VIIAEEQVQCLLHRRILCCCWWCCCGSSSCKLDDSLTVTYLDQLPGPMKPSSALFRLLSPRLAYWLVLTVLLSLLLVLQGEPLGSRLTVFPLNVVTFGRIKTIGPCFVGCRCVTHLQIVIHPTASRVQSPTDPSSLIARARPPCVRSTGKCDIGAWITHPTRLPYSWSRSTKACFTTPQEGPATHQDSIQTFRLALIS